MVEGIPQTRPFGEPTPSRGHWRKRQTPGLLKSAVQKAVRRGDLGLLRWALDRVWQRAEGRAWLCRRLPILAGEELWTHVGWAGYTARLGQGLLKRLECEEAAKTILTGAVGTLATAVKNKDGDGVQALARWEDELNVSASALMEALQAGQPVQVAAIAFSLLAQRGDPWSVLLQWTATHGTTETVLVVQEARARYGGGALEDDRRLFVGAAALAALCHGQVAGRVELRPVDAWPTPPG